jgi:hypothetical protein
LFLELIVREKANRPIAELAPGDRKNIPFYERLGAVFGFVERGLPLRSSPTTFRLSDFREDDMKFLSVPTRRGPRQFIVSGRCRRGTHVFVLTLSSTTVIENRLPFKMTIDIDGQVSIVQSGGETSTSIFTRKPPRYSLRIGLGQSPSMIGVSIEKKKLNPITIAMPGGNGAAMIAARAVVNSETKKLHITFYAPAVVYNMTSFRLSAFDRMGNLEAGFDPDLNLVLWGTPSFFQENSKLTLDLVFLEHLVLNPRSIDCLHPVSSESLRIELAPQLFVPARYTVQSAEPFSPSMVVTVFSNVEVQNHLRDDIILQPATGRDLGVIGHKFTVPAGQSAQIKEVTEKCLFGFLIEGEMLPVIISLENPLRLTFITDTGRLVELEVDELGVDLRATFRAAVIPQPYMISNRLVDCQIVARQSLRSLRLITVPPESTAIFALSDPTDYPTVELGIDGNFSTISLTEHFTVQRFHTKSGESVFVSVHPNPDSTRSVVVTSHLESLESMRREGHSLDLKVSIPVLHISLLSAEPREFALLTLRNVTGSLGRNRFLTNFGLFAHSFTLDDLHSESVIDVVASGDSCDNSHFLEFRASMFTNAPPFTSFDSISLDIQPMKLYIDIAFVSDLISFVSRLKPKAPKTSLQPMRPSVNRSGIARIPLSARLFQVSSLDAIAYRLNKSGRPRVYPMVIPMLKLVPNNLSGAVASVHPISLADVQMNYATVMRLAARWRREVKAQAVKILFDFDILSPPLAVGRSFARIKERCGNDTARVIASAAVQPLENVLRKGQQVLNWIQFDEVETAGVHGLNQTARQSVESGFVKATNSFLGAITGLVMDPIRESKKAKYRSKVLGAFVGIGKGVAGLVVKPVQGVIEAGTGLVTGMRKAVEGDEEVLRKQRPARGFQRRQILPYDSNAAVLQHICEASAGGELLENYYHSSREPKVLAVTKRHIYLVNLRGNVEQSIKIADLVRNSHEGPVIRIGVRGGPEFGFECQSAELAQDYVKRVRSNFYMLRIGYESE